MRNLLFGKLHALAGAAIGGFGVQIGRAFAKPLADNEAVLLENRTTVVSVTGRPDGYRADLLPHNLKVTGSNPVPATRHQAFENASFSRAFCCPYFG
jgi:hypothetical protein